MKYESIFSVGDTVWMVRHERFERIVRCSACRNTGKIKIGEEKFICPKCGGRAAHSQSAGERFYVYDSSIVGKVTVEDYPDNYRKDEPNPKFTYMVHATGVGSGQVWDQESLFGSKEEAESYCAVHNGMLPANETTMLPRPVDSWGRVLSTEE